jgi:hypothetical protein
MSYDYRPAKVAGSTRRREQWRATRGAGAAVAAKRRRHGAWMQRRVGLDYGSARGPQRQSVRGGGSGGAGVLRRFFLL